MKKIINLLLAALLIFSLFSCKQPNDEPSAVQPPAFETPYFLYDNVFSKGSSVRATGYGLFQNLTGKENLSTPSQGVSNIIFVQDFYFDKNKDLYILKYNICEGEDVSKYNVMILKYQFNKNNVDKYPSEPVILMEKEIQSLSTPYTSIAVNGNEIYLGYNTNHKIIISDIAGEPFNEKSSITLTEAEIPLAVEAGENNEIYVSTLKTAENSDATLTRQIFLYCFNKDQDGSYKEKIKKEINPITEHNMEFVSDLQYKDGSLYGIVSNYIGFKHLGGGLIKIDICENDFNVGQIFGYRNENAKFNFGDTPIKAYPAISKTSDFFYQPKKFIAIKPKKLVLSDEGFCYTDNNNNSVKSCDSVVTVDIKEEGFAISDRVIMENVKFSGNDEIPQTGYIDTDYSFILSQ